MCIIYLSNINNNNCVVNFLLSDTLNNAYISLILKALNKFPTLIWNKSEVVPCIVYNYQQVQIRSVPYVVSIFYILIARLNLLIKLNHSMKLLRACAQAIVRFIFIRQHVSYGRPQWNSSCALMTEHLQRLQL